MKVKGVKILIYSLLWLLVPQFHMFMNHKQVDVVDWIYYIEYKQDVQWYLKDMCDYLASLFLLLTIRLMLPIKFKIAGLCLIIAHIFDIINYWLFFHQYDWTYKSIAIFIIIISLYISHEKGNNIRPSS